MARFKNIVLAGLLMKSSLNRVRTEIKIKASVAIVRDESLLPRAVGCVKMLGFDCVLAVAFFDRNEVPLIRAKKIGKKI